MVNDINVNSSFSFYDYFRGVFSYNSHLIFMALWNVFCYIFQGFSFLILVLFLFFFSHFLFFIICIFCVFPIFCFSSFPFYPSLLHLTIFEDQYEINTHPALFFISRFNFFNCFLKLFLVEMIELNYCVKWLS